MFEIIHNKRLINTDEELKTLGIQYEAISKLNIQGNIGFSEEIKQLKDWLESHFKMYQYVKDNGVEYGDHELFYWSNHGDTLHFTININHSVVNGWESLVDTIIEYVSNELKQAEGHIGLQYQTEVKWDVLNDYIINRNFDIENLPFNILRFSRTRLFTGNSLNMEAKSKILEIENRLLESLENKKVKYDSICDGIFGASKSQIIGTIKRVGDNEFGVFKPRQTKSYYRINLATIENLCVA